jgi:hypothetical protein
VEGRHPPETASRTVEDIEDEELQERAEANLARLQNICKRAGMADLHGQNTLIKGDQIIPVDMEVVRLDVPTGLYMHDEPELLNLSAAEEEIIQEFIDGQENRLSQLVPLATHIFLEASIRPRIEQEFVDQLIDNLPEGELLVEREELEGYLRADFNRGDVPFFTIKEGIVYYGIGRTQIMQVGGNQNEHVE